MIKQILIILAILVPQIASAIIIKGKVVDNKKVPLVGATIVLSKDSTIVVKSTNADTDGKFQLSTSEKGELSIKISMIGYLTTNIQFEMIDDEKDLKTIILNESSVLLNEVVVKSQNVIEKGSNYIVFPNTKELKQSSSSIDLLELIQYKLPGLQVNSSLNRVTIENGAAIFQINGREVDYSRIQSINNDNILRIEYSNVSDIRYGTAVMGVINYITKPVTQGGSVYVNGMAATKLTNANVGIVYNYGKSEWTLDYGNSWRNFDKIYNSGTECFIGRETPIVREKLAIPSKFKTLTNDFSFGYSYIQNPQSLFAITLSGNTNYIKETTFNNILQTYQNDQDEYLTTAQSKNNSFSPKIDIYYKRQLTQTSKFEVNAYGNNSSGDYKSHLDYESLPLKYSLHSITNNKAWRIGTEVLYTKSYNKFETKYGLNYYHNYAKNDYTENENNSLESRHNNDNLYLHGSISGKIKKLTYSVGLGGRYYGTDNGDLYNNTFKLNSKVVANYKINTKWSLNYLLMLEPTMPTLVSQEDIIKIVDDISYKTGNPNLKASTYLRNRIYLRYATQKFNASLWFAHSFNNNPIYNKCSYISDVSSPYYNSFIFKNSNAKHDNLINLELNVLYTGIKNFLIAGVVGYDNYSFSGYGDIESFNKIYTNISAAFFYKNWRFSGRFDIKSRYSLSSNILKTAERCNAIIAQYKWRDFWFMAGILNPFTTKGVLYNSKELSAVHPTDYESYVKDCANMVTIGVTYRINFGKSLKKPEQEIKNKEIDSGLEVKKQADIKL